MKDQPQTGPRGEPAATDADEKRGDLGNTRDKARVPIVTRMPEGYEVIEQRAGRAVGQWVLQVRCECGRRWFEVEAIDAARCPRCGSLVYIDVQPRSK